jgi:undecaprenyl-diphosphatase
LDLLQAAILAFVQGLSEFLPISSSGHLILVPHFLGWRDQGLAYDVAVHVGTLVAVAAYFRGPLAVMIREGLGWRPSQPASPDARLAWCIVLATVPVGLVGLTFAGLIEEHLRNPLFVAGTLSFFGVLMWVADRLGRQARDEYTVGWREAVIIGCAQALSLMPGTSRSGITITAGLALGMTRSAAARFSFLLAVPGIAMAGVYELAQLLSSGEAVDWPALSLGVVVSAVTGYASIHVLLKFIERVGLLPFTLYRLLIAGLIVLHFA